MKIGAISREDIKRIRKDRQRIFRVVEDLRFSAMIENSPVQISQGYIIADVNTYEIFACIIFQNFSQKEIESVSIRLLLYKNQNIPYLKLPYTYSSERMTLGIRTMPEDADSKKIFNFRKKMPKNIRVLESFGSASYIRLPDSYFSKIEFELLNVVFADGTTKEINAIISNNVCKISQLSDEQQYAYSRINIYSDAEQYHPSKVIPVATEDVWLCCCGTKNISSADVCSLCGRERDWQLQTLKEDVIENKVKELKRDSDKMLLNRDHFKGYEKEETAEEIKQKLKKYEKVLNNIAENERKRERRNMMIIPKFLLWYSIVMLILYLINNINQYGSI